MPTVPDTALKWTGCTFPLDKLVNPSWGETYMHVISNSNLVKQRTSSLGKVRTDSPITTQAGPATYVQALVRMFLSLAAKLSRMCLSPQGTHHLLAPVKGEFP